MKSQLDRRLALLLLAAVAGLDTPLKVVEAKLGGAQTYDEPRPRLLQTSDNSKRLEIFRKTLPTRKDYKRMKQNGVVLEPSELSPHAPLEDTFKLHSYPKGQTDQILYLDFDGHSPGGYKPFDLDGDPETFNAAERTVIQQAWHSISEDFIPWNIDVTTELPDSNQDWVGVRAVISDKCTYALSVRIIDVLVIAHIPSFSLFVSFPLGGYSWAYLNTWELQNSRSEIAFAWTGDNTWLWIADSVVHEVS